MLIGVLNYTITIISEEKGAGYSSKSSTIVMLIIEWFHNLHYHEQKASA